MDWKYPVSYLILVHIDSTRYALWTLLVSHRHPLYLEVINIVWRHNRWEVLGTIPVRGVPTSISTDVHDLHVLLALSPLESYTFSSLETCILSHTSHNQSATALSPLIGLIKSKLLEKTWGGKNKPPRPAVSDWQLWRTYVCGYSVQ